MEIIYGIEPKLRDPIPIHSFFVTLLDKFYTEFDSRKIIDGKNYVLKDGIIVLDVRSYLAGSGIAPLSITSRYETKPFLGSPKILSEQVIINAGKDK